MYDTMKLQIAVGSPEYHSAKRHLTIGQTVNGIATFYVFYRENLVAYRKTRIASYK